MKHAAIIFDLFGTLIDSFSTREYEEMLAQMADLLAAPKQDFVKLWHTSYDQRARGTLATAEICTEYVCRELGLEPRAEQIAQAGSLRLEFTRQSLTPREGVVETLGQLRARGYKVGLISDCSLEVPLLWSALSIAPLIEEPIFSCSVGLRKPDQRIYELACERLGVRPEQCLYVGDGGSCELSGATAVGMRAVMIKHPNDALYDPHQVDTENWDGPRITSIEEVLSLVN